ncbi:MAG: hypothetical protein AVDCRST_MAG74-869 [uncultured Pyrinomonadaceae bacterium]|uniref:CHRD domain-containing protein n=1 Tax=uncultured Pyrinomonadaceae bacterium TaxID=2283094 RepID=A0A6J4NMX5_9BACT|nr:MAG: hypothetical protein AVDCRST_MAG74-869 [uncultured Pyrinomonadaceae bacterium]
MKKQSIISRPKTLLWLAALIAAVMLTTDASAQQKFLANLSGLQQVPATRSTGKGVAVVTLNADETQATISVNYSGLSSAVTAIHIHGNAAPGQNAAAIFTVEDAATGTINRTFNLTRMQVGALRSQRLYFDIHTKIFPDGEIRGQIKRASMFADEDGDGRDDYITYRQGDNTFYSLLSLGDRVQTRSFGETTPGFLNGSFIGDFDGDGLADPVRFRVNATSGLITWLIYQTDTNTVRSVDWGNFATDFVAVGDYDGDAKQDVAVFRISEGIWYIIESSTGAPRYEYFGAPGDASVPGDYDKDGKTDAAVTRDIDGKKHWFIKQSSNGQVRVEQWGLPSDTTFGFGPSLIDFDGDGAQDLVVQRNIDGAAYFYVRRSSDNSFFVEQWGLATDIVFIGIDHDGDGKSDIEAIRPINGQNVWFSRLSSTGESRAVVWGSASDQ